MFFKVQLLQLQDTNSTKLILRNTLVNLQVYFLCWIIFSHQVSSIMSSSTIRQICGSLIVSLIHLLAGASIPLSSIIIPSLEMSDEEISWFASIITLGILVGSLAGCIYCDLIGRKKSLMIDCCGFLIGFTIIGFGGNDILMLCVGRFITGFFFGTMKCSMMVYICEFSQPRLRGLMGGLNMLVFMIGFSFHFLLNMMCHWTIVTLSLCVPAVLAFLGLALLQESPVWLMRRKGKETAEKSLKFFRGENSDIINELEEIKQSIAMTEESQGSKLSMFKNKVFYRPFSYLCFVMVALQWSSYPVLGTYMITIFKLTGSTFDPKISSLIVCFVRIIFALFTSSLLLHFPRRCIYFLAASITCLSLFLLGGFCYAASLYDLHDSFKILPLVFIIFIYIGFSLGYGTISIILQGEVFPPNMRSIGCGIILCFEMISAFTAIKTSGFIISCIGLHGLFCVYSAVVFLVILLAVFFMPETKDKTLAEIQKKYLE